MLISEECGKAIPKAAYTALRKKGIRTIDDLQNFTKDEIAILYGISQGTMRSLEEAMEKSGAKWAAEVKPSQAAKLLEEKKAEPNSYKPLEQFDHKQTKWEGLWWHPETNSFGSAAINFKQLRDFKGTARLYVRKNRWYNGGENGRPNYVFSFRDASAMNEIELMVEDMDGFPTKSGGHYFDEKGERLYTAEDARKIINGVVADVEYGIHDPYDLLPEDYA